MSNRDGHSTDKLFAVAGGVIGIAVVLWVLYVVFHVGQ